MNIEDLNTRINFMRDHKPLEPASRLYVELAIVCIAVAILAWTFLK